MTTLFGYGVLVLQAAPLLVVAGLALLALAWMLRLERTGRIAVILILVGIVLLPGFMVIGAPMLGNFSF